MRIASRFWAVSVRCLYFSDLIFCRETRILAVFAFFACKGAMLCHLEAY